MSNDSRQVRLLKLCLHFISVHCRLAAAAARVRRNFSSYIGYVFLATQLTAAAFGLPFVPPTLPAARFVVAAATPFPSPYAPPFPPPPFYQHPLPPVPPLYHHLPLPLPLPWPLLPLPVPLPLPLPFPHSLPIPPAFGFGAAAAPVILSPKAAVTLSVASLIHALIARKFHPPVLPYAVPRPFPVRVPVKIPLPIAADTLKPVTPLLRSHGYYEHLHPADYLSRPVPFDDPEEAFSSAAFDSEVQGEAHDWHPPIPPTTTIQ